MSEKPLLHKTPNEHPPKFTKGISIVKKGPQGPKEIYEFVGPNSWLLELKDPEGKTIFVDHRYLFDNFEPYDYLPKAVLINGIEYKVRSIDNDNVQLFDLEEPNNRITISVKDLKKFPAIHTSVPTPAPSTYPNLQKSSEIKKAEAPGLKTYKSINFGVKRRISNLNLLN